MNNRMMLGEAMEFYCRRVIDIFHKWPNNQILEPFLLYIFINGLHPFELKKFVKEAKLATMNAS